jgi:hypothetical protein
METQGETGGFPGGGSANSVCAISPSDLVGTIDNLISRIEKLESTLSQVLGANLHSETLSELSQQVGWVYGVEYMGVPGWIQTEYGTLIPPPGFTLSNGGLTLSDGSTYQAVVMDENGVLQFGFGQTTSDGDFTAVTGAMASAQNIAILKTNDPILPTTTTTSSTFPTEITSDYDPSSLVTIVGDHQFTLNQTGIYLLTSTVAINAYTAVGGVGQFSWSISFQPVSYGIHRTAGPHVYWQSNASLSNPATQSVSRIMRVSSDATHTLSAIALVGAGPATIQIGGATLGIQLLKGL